MNIMRIDPRKIIRTLKKHGQKVRETARELGLSPGTVLNWKKRAEGLFTLRYLDRYSTCPNRIRGHILSFAQQEAIKLLRAHRSYGAQKIKYILKIPSHHNTIHRFLKNKGFITEGTTYRRPHYQPTTHMHTKNALVPGKLQMDVKFVTPELSGLSHTCYLYAIMDIFTRMKQGVIFPLLDQSYAIEAMRILLPQFPFRADFIQTDNGLEFQARFHAYVESLPMQHHHIHKSSPNENAVIERSFRTDEEEFFFWRMQKPQNLLDLNMQYQTYIFEYNNERPHLSLHMMTPMEKYQSVQ
ncbi:MAG: integrase core domain-containing protein [Patescibacteria group bacterium]|nr:integrase core domain-containing protein [Patescibacteria group bacterium]MCL5012034.1 integrase core domain-containing protein [Patescibacteria group bacterium]